MSKKKETLKRAYKAVISVESGKTRPGKGWTGYYFQNLTYRRGRWTVDPNVQDKRGSYYQQAVDPDCSCAPGINLFETLKDARDWMRWHGLGILLSVQYRPSDLLARHVGLHTILRVKAIKTKGPVR